MILNEDDGVEPYLNAKQTFHNVLLCSLWAPQEPGQCGTWSPCVVLHFIEKSFDCFKKEGEKYTEQLNKRLDEQDPNQKKKKMPSLAADDIIIIFGYLAATAQVPGDGSGLRLYAMLHYVSDYLKATSESYLQAQQLPRTKWEFEDRAHGKPNWFLTNLKVGVQMIAKRAKFDTSVSPSG